MVRSFLFLAENQNGHRHGCMLQPKPCHWHWAGRCWPTRMDATSWESFWGGQVLLKGIQHHRARRFLLSGWRFLYSGNGPLYHWRAEIFPRRCSVLSRPRRVQNSSHHWRPRGVQCLPVAIITKPANHLFLQGKHPNTCCCAVWSSIYISCKWKQVDKNNHNHGHNHANLDQEQMTRDC